ncbi:MAG: DegT/DnrJ/EryC1/StrS family aminotransferase [Crocosphaera sp.]|nr:DegT/DnrJ/EryC1/StrS family aminotransferase [Crocosphaera sp.]
MTRQQYLPFGKPNFSHLEISAITQVLESGWIGMGKETIAFEKELETYLEADHVVTVDSCTSALFLSLLVSGVQPGDEVICPSLTWCSTANVILYLGATPVFCDIDPKTFCVSSESVQEKLTERTKAVIVVHLGGLAVDVEDLRETLPDKITIIEDAAHALGSKYPNGKPVGSSGNLTCFSFYANKNLSTGDGGAIALFEQEIAERLSSLRQNGMPLNAWKRFTNPKTLAQFELRELGYKMNYTDLQACIGRIQLRRQPEFQRIRWEIANYYYQSLSCLGISLDFQDQLLHEYHARHLFLIVLPIETLGQTRDEILIAMRSQNIGVSIHYPPLHKMSLYQTHVSLPHTEDICRRIITLPISASMTLDDGVDVVDNLKNLMESKQK